MTTITHISLNFNQSIFNLQKFSCSFLALSLPFTSGRTILNHFLLFLSLLESFVILFHLKLIKMAVPCTPGQLWLDNKCQRVLIIEVCQRVLQRGYKWGYKVMPLAPGRYARNWKVPKAKVVLTSQNTLGYCSQSLRPHTDVTTSHTLFRLCFGHVVQMQDESNYSLRVTSWGL